MSAASAPKPATHPPVDDPGMAQSVDAAIAAGDLPTSAPPAANTNAYIRGSVVIVSNDEDGDETAKYSWLNTRLTPPLRPKSLDEVGTIIVARRKREIVYSVLAPRPGEKFAERSDFFNKYRIALLDRQRNVVIAERTFERGELPIFPPRDEDILVAMISWIEHLPRRAYAPHADTKIPKTDTR